MADSVFALTLKVTMMRYRLSEMVTNLGVTHPRVRALNRRLDKLAVELQRRMAG